MPLVTVKALKDLQKATQSWNDHTTSTVHGKDEIYTVDNAEIAKAAIAAGFAIEFARSGEEIELDDSTASNLVEAKLVEVVEGDEFVEVSPLISAVEPEPIQ
jgi:S-adenosylmethionine hydrolase